LSPGQKALIKAAEKGDTDKSMSTRTYRHRGLAAAALTIHYRRMKELGAECMTGGGNDFYRKIGYNRKSLSYGWKKYETKHETGEKHQ